MAYDEEKLSRGEQIVSYARRHLFYLFTSAFRAFILFVLSVVAFILILTLFRQTDQNAGWFMLTRNILATLALIGALVSFISFLISYFVWRAEQYVITNERIIHTWGIVNKNETAIPVDKVNDIVLYQGLVGRMVGFGNIKLETGNNSPEVLDYLAKPQEFKKTLLDVKNKHYGDASDNALGGFNDPRRMPPIQQGYPQPQYQQPTPFHPQQPQQPRYQQQPIPPGDPRGYAPPAPAPAGGDRQQILQTIQQLAQLRDAGAISEAEFQAKKNELMSRL
jgi:membrane protein YdbS with pleckstrin-like domain